MFGLGIPEVVVLLLWAAGVACAVAGTRSKVFGVRGGIVAMAIAVLVPGLGSVGVIASPDVPGTPRQEQLTWADFSSIRHHVRSRSFQGSTPAGNFGRTTTPA